MASFNSDFWEVQAEQSYIESIPADRGLWYETDQDRERRYAFKDFFQTVRPVVMDIVEAKLTTRQKEVVELYFLYGKTQEDIAVILDLTQSTVSRHLFGTVRNGKKVGGAVPKLKKIVSKTDSPQIGKALNKLATRLV